MIKDNIIQSQRVDGVIIITKSIKNKKRLAKNKLSLNPLTSKKKLNESLNLNLIAKSSVDESDAISIKGDSIELPIDLIIKIGHILTDQGKKKKEKQKNTKPFLFKGNLLQHMLFIAWVGEQTNTEEKDIWVSLTCLYYDYEQYVRSLGERPISRHNHFEGLKKETTIEYKRKRDGFYISGLKLKAKLGL
jgi:hypothetical protein